MFRNRSIIDSRYLAALAEWQSVEMTLRALVRRLSSEFQFFPLFLFSAHTRQLPEPRIHLTT